MRTLLLLVVALVIGFVAAYLATGVASVPPAEASVVHPIVGKWRTVTFLGQLLTGS